ncbi:MAG: hypothetical protein WC028_18420 [Candidatus Obscuribacterales bacterium]
MKARRKSTGGQIAELAPALLILFLVILFPMVDLLYLSIGYCAGWYLNQMTAKACATTPITTTTPTPADYAPAANAMKTAWEGSGLAAFTGAVVVANGAKSVNFGTVVDRETGLPMRFVQVDTQVQIKPFLSLGGLPFMAAMNIDGLTRPITFRYQDNRPSEETGVN